MKRVKKRNTIVTNNWIIPKRFLVFYLFIMFILLIQFAHISLFKVVNGNNLREIAANRTTVTKNLIAARGTIYDNDGNILATNVASYTLIAYLSETRTDNPDNPRHVVDKEKTAKLLSEKLDAPYDYIYDRLTDKGRYQVEFGKYGSKLTELEKIAIEKLELPGIDFVESTKRFYPNGQFASYIVGYAKEYTRINLKLKEEYDLRKMYENYFDKYDNIVLKIGDDSIISSHDSNLKAIKVGSTSFKLTIGNSDKILVYGIINVSKNELNKTDIVTQGELGIEGKFDEVLKGTNGSLTYQQDPSGYKIPDTPEEKIEAVDGKDIYLTIDSSIQRFLETSVKKEVEKYKPEWMIMAVMDAKTGEILGSATSPNFDPNNLTSDMKYQNALVSYSYEPGSVMKIYTYLCAANTGKYDGNKTFSSGSIDINGTVVKDYAQGLGKITYDYGFIKSSNVGAINISRNYLSPSMLKGCLKTYGFGSKTDIELSGEIPGNINYRENIELDYLSVSFGQGLMTTPIQQLQGLSIIANNGQMIKPHIIKKIVDKKTGEEELTKTEVSDRLVSKEAVATVKKLMYNNVQNQAGTGHAYYIKDFDVIGKTGTAQIYENGHYLDGAGNNLVSFAGMFPYDDPEIIIYTAIKKPKTYKSESIAPYVKEVIGNIAKYKNMYSDVEENNSSIKKYKTASFINSDLVVTKSKLEKINMKVVVIGDGDKIISQFPKEGSSVVTGDKFYLVTNGNKTTMPDMKGWALSDLSKFAELSNAKYKYKGHGFITKQNIKPGSIISGTIEVELNN